MERLCVIGENMCVFVCVCMNGREIGMWNCVIVF